MLYEPFNQKQRGKYNQYHSSIKLFIASGGNPALAFDLNIPFSTLSSWKRTDFSNLITHPIAGSAKNDLLLFQKFIKNRFAMRLFDAYISISETFFYILRSVTTDLNKSLNNSKEFILKTINAVKQTIGLDKTLRLLKISRQRYDMWTKNKSCLASPIGLCVKIHPLQITKDELNKLRYFLQNFTYTNWPLNSVYFYGLRKKSITFSLSTFYKYAKLLGFSNQTPKNRHKNHCIGLRATRINQYWHADVTIFKPLDNTKVYIYLVIDNFSRYILSWHASLELSAKIRFETITEAYQNFVKKQGNEIINVVVDGGSENNLIPLNPTDILSVKKIIAQQDISFSNSMIEALNKQIKYRYLFQKELLDFNATVEHLKKSVPDFNNNRPYAPLHGLTPAEVYIGRLTPDKNRFNELIETAKQQRYIENKSEPCPICAD